MEVLQQKSLRTVTISVAQTNQAIELISAQESTSKAHKFTRCRNTKAMISWLNSRTKEAKTITSRIGAKIAIKRNRYQLLVNRNRPCWVGLDPNRQILEVILVKLMIVKIAFLPNFIYRCQAAKRHRNRIKWDRTPNSMIIIWTTRYILTIISTSLEGGADLSKSLLSLKAMWGSKA